MTTCTIYENGYTSQLVLDYLRNPPEGLKQTGLKIIFSQQCSNANNIIQAIIKEINRYKPDIKISLDLSDLKKIEPTYAYELKFISDNLELILPNEQSIRERDLPAQTKGELVLNRVYKNAISEPTPLPLAMVDIVMGYVGRFFVQYELDRWSQIISIDAYIDIFKNYIKGLEYQIASQHDEQIRNNQLTGFSYVKAYTLTLFNDKNIKTQLASLNEELATAKKCLDLLSGANPSFTDKEKVALQSHGTTLATHFEFVKNPFPEFADAVLGNRPLFKLK